MTRRNFIWQMPVALACLSSLSLWADEQVYGSELMTEKERNEHRNMMRNAKNEQEREQIRKEHHKKMKERAKERGLSMPEEPPARGGKGSMRNMNNTGKCGTGKCGGGGRNRR